MHCYVDMEYQLYAYVSVDTDPKKATIPVAIRVISHQEKMCHKQKHGN